MKKKHILLSLAASFLLVGCAGTIEAVPGNVDDNLVNFSGNSTEYFRNDIQMIYDQLVDAGTSNSTILNAILKMIAEDPEKGIFKDFTTEEHIQELCKEKMIDKVKSGSYDVNGLFQESKLISELKASLYDIKSVDGAEPNDNHLLLPTDEYDDIFNYDYSDYIERNIRKDVVIQELTAKYLFKEDYSSLRKSYARRVRYIALEEIEGHKGEAARTLTAFINKFVNNPQVTDFDLDSLARIWTGVESTMTEDEIQFVNENGLYTLSDQIVDELAKIVEVDENGDPTLDEKGEYIMKGVKATDESLESKYTGSYTYPVRMGHILAERELAKTELVEDDLFIKNNGINDLPSKITDRIFSNQINRTNGYLVSAPGKDDIKFLVPERVENNNDFASKIIHYDASSSTRYVVIVDAVYNSLTELDDKDAVEIAEILAENSTNKRDSIIHYLKEFNIEIHDQAFYDYINSTYSEVFEED